MRRKVDRSSRFVCKARERVAGLFRSHVNAAAALGKIWKFPWIMRNLTTFAIVVETKATKFDQKWNLEIKKNWKIEIPSGR